MARPLRINVENGWYHITSRGNRGEAIFLDKRDHLKFLDLVGELGERHRVQVHGYVLMGNHYHLLIRTPDANASRAMQWVNLSYSMWWNKRHGRIGHLFQGRFKGVLIEGGAWMLETSLYVHYNPVAVKSLGWTKKEKKVECLGLKSPEAKMVKARLETLRSDGWSSYRAYAGYERKPPWLFMQEVLRRAGNSREGYRKLAEERLKQGQSEDLWSRVKWGAVLGSEAFAEKMKEGVDISRETAKRKELRRELNWEQIVSAVEEVKGEKWKAFCDRHGDWGRDLALWYGRRYAGLRLWELGERAGGLDYSATSEAIRYFERVKMKRPEIQRAHRRVAQFLNLEL